jgi:prepilin peptidase CpaA
MVEIALLVFPGLMLFAAASDLLTMTIPNRIAIALGAAFLILAVVLRLPAEIIGWHLLAGLFVLAITFGLFAARWIGGGDAKLAAATALWMGWENLADYALCATILGGVLTLALLQLRKWPLPAVFGRQEWIARLHDKATGVPYGIALALAGLILYPDTRIWLAGAF